MASDYVHGYGERESQRLGDQATTLNQLLHHDTIFPDGASVLEAGCGVGSQTGILAASSPGARITSIDRSPESLALAQRACQDCANVTFEQADIFDLPFAAASFDHVFVCFVLEHLKRPLKALAELIKVLKPGGSMTVIEGDHGSCYFHPRSAMASKAWQCLIDVQAGLGGDSLIGRRVYPLMAAAGLEQVRVSPRMVYCDASNPELVDGFVKKTIIPMVEGVHEEALEEGMIQEPQWRQGIADLHKTALSDGTFCYTFFKGVGFRPA